MKMHELTTVTGLTAALIFSAPVLAAGEEGYGGADPATQHSQSFESLDTNQDGELSASEASQEGTLSEQWDTYDQDGSGTLDQSEFSAFEEEQRPEGESGSVDDPSRPGEGMGEEEPGGMAE